MRKEILEHVHELEEKIHLLGGVLASSFVLTFAVSRWRAHGTGQENQFLEVLDWILLGVDVVIVVLFAGALMFRWFGLAKPSRRISRAFEDERLNKKLRDWFTSEIGDPSPQSVRFCSLEEIEGLVELNHEAFKNSAFEVEKEKLMKRNSLWIRRNPRVFLMILDPLNKEQYVGYSAMVPLTREGLDCYLDGGIKDADVPASFLATGKAATAGVLIFAIYLRPDFSFQKSEASRNYSIYFLACVRYHLASLFPKPRNGQKVTPYPPIYVQTEYAAMKRRIQHYGFVETDKRSADGYDLLVFEQPFKHPAQSESPVTLEHDPGENPLPSENHLD